MLICRITTMVLLAMVMLPGASAPPKKRIDDGGWTMDVPRLSCLVPRLSCSMEISKRLINAEFSCMFPRKSPSYLSSQDFRVLATCG